MASQLCTGLLLCLSLLFDVVLTFLNDFELRHVGDYPSVFSCGKVVTSFTGFNFSMNLFCLTKGLRFVSIDCSFTHSIELCCKTRNDNNVLSSRENSFILVVRIFRLMASNVVTNILTIFNNWAIIIVHVESRGIFKELFMFLYFSKECSLVRFILLIAKKGHRKKLILSLYLFGLWKVIFCNFKHRGCLSGIILSIHSCS